jgi:hypothetical protein
MPTYTITDPTTKRTHKVTGDSPPSEAELTQIFSRVGESAAPASTDWSARLGLHAPTASPALGFLRGAGTAAVDMAEGAVSGAASTVYQGGDLIRRGLGMPRVLERPDAQQAMHAPETVAGTIGRGVEQAAEFGVPLSKVSKATAASSLLTRAAAEGAASAGVAGAQTGGDPGAMLLSGAGGVVLPFAGAAARTGAKVARQAAAGAQEGGLGGAVASAVRNVAPGEPRVMLTQALKPRNAAVNWGGSVDRALPELKAAEAALGKPVESLDDLRATIKTAKAANRAEYNAVAGPLRDQGTTVDLTPVADNIVKNIPRKLQVTNPARAKAIAKATTVYRKRFTLEDAETLLQDTNAELEAHYAQFPQAQRAALRAKPEIAQLVSEAEALRTAIYDTLDAAAPNASAREVQRRYGALLDIEQEAMRRANVAARQQPESLSEQIGAVRAAADMARGGWRLAHGDLSGAADIAAAHAGRATSKAIKESQTTDALIRRAFAGYQTPTTQAAAAAARGVR